MYAIQKKHDYLEAVPQLSTCTVNVLKKLVL